MVNIPLYAKKAAEIVKAGQFLYSRGWSPATSSNYSARIDDKFVAITVSGKHKGELTEKDVMVVDLDGNPVYSDTKSSAETLLHTILYQVFSEAGAVLHTHSVGSTVLSRYLGDKESVVFKDYELQKAFAGHVTHEGEIEVPIFENTQDIAALASETQKYFFEKSHVPAYLIRGHGLYTWGKDMEECLRHVEALEFLIQCELEMIRLGSK